MQDLLGDKAQETHSSSDEVVDNLSNTQASPSQPLKILIIGGIKSISLSDNVDDINDVCQNLLNNINSPSSLREGIEVNYYFQDLQSLTIRKSANYLQRDVDFSSIRKKVKDIYLQTNYAVEIIKDIALDNQDCPSVSVNTHKIDFFSIFGHYNNEEEVNFERLKSILEILA